jgi:hypothetical protein
MATAVRSEKKKSPAAEAKKVNFGKVVQVIGPVLDVEFESEHLPELYNALRIREKSDAGAEIDVVVKRSSTSAATRCARSRCRRPTRLCAG